ncbi:Ubiquitin-conjugating_enzyme E2 [Hexamita inflata]|uniref:Ubiquitin-conjugating enzyme E2 n=1 Tax=Hexamita inflata TaxID=28002 RepID=A0AA86T8Q4_9EUKA|nr:Ubiquitin-conjugating enzyme E2 [Hexamita inflata]
MFSVRELLNRINESQISLNKPLKSKTTLITSVSLQNSSRLVLTNEITPDAYDLSNYNPFGSRSLTIREKTKPKTTNTVSPSRYSLPNVKQNGISIHQRPLSKKNKQITPGPGAYKFIKRAEARNNTLPLDITQNTIIDSPGPQKYSPKEPNFEPRCKSQHTLRHKHNKLQDFACDWANTPGPAYDTRKELQGKGGKIAVVYKKKEQLIPGPYDTRDALDLILRKNDHRLNIQKSYLSPEELLQLQASTHRFKPKPVTVVLNREERWQKLEQKAPYMTYKVNDKEIHFSIAGDEKYYQGMIHGAVYISNKYPYNNPTIKIFNECFKQELNVNSAILNTWNPEKGLYPILEDLLWRIKDLVARDNDLVKQSAICSRSTICNQCGCESKLLWRELLQRKDNWSGLD